MPQPEIDIENIIKNAIGDKPYSVQNDFNNAVVQRAADIISGKREDIAKSYSLNDVDDEALTAEPTEDELEDILKDLDDSEEDFEDEVEFEDEEDLDDEADAEEEQPEELDEPEEDEDSEEEENGQNT